MCAINTAEGKFKGIYLVSVFVNSFQQASDEAIKASTGLFDPNSKMFISAIAFFGWTDVCSFRGWTVIPVSNIRSWKKEK